MTSPKDQWESVRDHDAALRERVAYLEREVAEGDRISQENARAADAAEAEVGRLKESWDSMLVQSAKNCARADAAEAEVERWKERERESGAEADLQRARVAALTQIIEAAPHGIGCAFCAWTEKGSARIAGPCDCWKAKAEVGK